METERNGSDFFTEPQEFPRLSRKVFSTFLIYPTFSNISKKSKALKTERNESKRDENKISTEPPKFPSTVEKFQFLFRFEYQP